MNKRHRVFIAINLPGDVKKTLARYEEKWGVVPAKWTPKDNLHITLVFLGDVTDEELGEVCMIAKEIAKKHQPFEISLKNVGYGPDEKLPPRMIWASGEKSSELSALKQELEFAFLQNIDFKPELKVFSPHITLARVSAFAWRAIEPEERPEVGEMIELPFTVESIDVMESELKKGGPQYTIVDSHQLQ